MNKYSLKNMFKRINVFSEISSDKKDFYKKASKVMLNSALVPAVFAVASTAYASETIDIGEGESHRFFAKGNITRVAIGDPQIADVVTLDGTNNELLVVGKKVGSTSLLVWRGGVTDTYVITVGANDAGMSSSIKQAIGLPSVNVRVATIGGKKRVLLEGRVRDQVEHDRAVKIASLYTGDKLQDPKRRGTDDEKFEYDVAYRSNGTYENVVDLLVIEAPTQIRIEAQIVEVSNDDEDKWGLTYGNPSGEQYIGEENTFYAGSGIHRSNAGNPRGQNWFVNSFAQVNARLELLMKKGKAKILSRPSISTVSGSKAKIHIGGEIPYTKSNKDGEISYEWKSYGIRLNIDPVIGENDDVTAEVHAEVSTPDWDNGIISNSIRMPAVRKRDVHSLVHIDAGKTMVIGGLLNSEDAKVVKKVPLLSSLPIIGEFFKHHTNDNEKRELVILLTPRIVSQDDPAQMTDKMTEWYAKNQYEADQRNLVDVNNPPLPKEVEEKLEKEEKEKKEKEMAENPENPGTRMYERWQRETGGSAESSGSDYGKFANVNTP
ncbi:MAG: pilus assembly protein N-terminal domain-containing protein [Selenomonadaceae bacterium]|nr:pilus assembly protein N-terminal domain-containing protein [Selenomonadaceae bacterium]